MPPASVTAVIVPATSTGLLIVIATPGISAPCSSVARTRMLPVCTCAAAGAASPIAASRANLKIHFIVVPPQPSTTWTVLRPERKKLYQTASGAVQICDTETGPRPAQFRKVGFVAPTDIV